MTSDAPTGEVVVVSEQAGKPAAGAPAPAPAVARRDVPEAGWLGSSFDLLNGVEITESPDSVPGDVFDTLFKKPTPTGRS